MKFSIEIETPDSVTIGDFQTVQGALVHAATGYIDWEALHNGEAKAIDAPGVILLDIARAVGTHAA